MAARRYYNNYLMSNPDIDSTFRKLVGHLDLRKDGMFELASLDGYKDKLYDRLIDHLKTLALINVYNNEEYEKACRQLNIWMKKDFEDLSGELERGSEVVTCEEGVLYMLRDSDTRKLCTQALKPGVRIRGDVHGLVVDSMPDVTRLAKDIELFDGAINKFGLGVLITNAKIDDMKNTAPLGELPTHAVCIPINGLKMPLKRVIPSTIESE